MFLTLTAKLEKPVYVNSTTIILTYRYTIPVHVQVVQRDSSTVLICVICAHTCAHMFICAHTYMCTYGMCAHTVCLYVHILICAHMVCVHIPYNEDLYILTWAPAFHAPPIVDHRKWARAARRRRHHGPARNAHHSCPASSATVERLFSQVGIAFADLRKNSTAETLRDILFTKLNID